MKKTIDDKEYLSFVNHILTHEEFRKIKAIEHHGISRYDHSVKVSYYSYKIAKLFHLNYEVVARGGLLHDFFLSDADRTQKDRLVSTFVHPKLAVQHADEVFGINSIEQDIIRTHMFPVNVAIPKYMESWIVSLVDKVVAVEEFAHKFRYQLAYTSNLFIIFLMNGWK